MNSINYHIKALVTTFKELFQGNFLLYFIPGSVLTLIYLWFYFQTTSVAESLLIETDSSWINWAKGTINSSIEGLFGLFNFVVEQIYIFATITLLSPFNTILSEKLENKLTGSNFKSSILQFINDIIRMVFVVMIAITLEIAFLSFYYIISWIFGLGAIDGIVFFIISAFFYGLSFYDFSLERYKIGVFGTIGFAFSRPLSMMLTGSIFILLYSIPVIGVPIAPVIAVMVSTIVYLYATKKLPTINNLQVNEKNE